MAVKDSLWAIWSVWHRYFDVVKKNLWLAIINTFIEPSLFLVGFGFGLANLIGPLHINGVDLTYRQFILSGLVAQTLLFQGFFEGAYGGFFRMFYQKIFHAIAITPITLSEIIWGELLWDSMKAAFAATIVLLIGTLLGDFFPWQALLAIPVCFIGGILFSGFGLLVAGLARRIDQISYPQYLLVTPMFLFCGTFFPLEELPSLFQWVAWALPLTPLLSLLRSLVLDLPFQLQAIPLLLIWVVSLLFFARRVIINRLIA